MVNKQEQEFKTLIEEKLKEQFVQGMKKGAYGIAGAIYDMIHNYKGNDSNELIEKIDKFLIPTLRNK